MEVGAIRGNGVAEVPETSIVAFRVRILGVELLEVLATDRTSFGLRIIFDRDDRDLLLLLFGGFLVLREVWKMLKATPTDRILFEPVVL